MSASSFSHTPASPTAKAISEKIHVARAVILRDMRTRFLNHGLGFLIVPLFPFVHLVFLLVAYRISGRQTPYGDSLNVYVTTALIPTLTFMYVSRFMSLSLLMNRPMLAFPVVRILDIIFARAFLEVVAGIISTLMILFSLMILGDNVIPHDPLQALCAYLATILFSLGAGIIVSVFALFSPTVLTGFVLMQVATYITSGALFNLADLPSPVANILLWNPILHASEWMRVAFYEGYPDQYLNKSYLLFLGLGLNVIGLSAERFFRGKLLEG
ncbi:ABC transporter permease [Roseibium aggregatum]|uniref:ABC transporter permease n=1 Tax=Roseibium aggregatum TaxID=187304 RepID=A0A926P071_9HYPH|nr:ABC transporter permease [Roseibium aggregatum]MBD1549649.1 ABC transporter permease [Roseibium aggregatum]